MVVGEVGTVEAIIVLDHMEEEVLPLKEIPTVATHARVHDLLFDAVIVYHQEGDHLAMKEVEQVQVQVQVQVQDIVEGQDREVIQFVRVGLGLGLSLPDLALVPPVLVLVHPIHRTRGILVVGVGQGHLVVQGGVTAGTISGIAGPGRLGIRSPYTLLVASCICVRTYYFVCCHRIYTFRFHQFNVSSLGSKKVCALICKTQNCNEVVTSLSVFTVHMILSCLLVARG